MTENVTTTPALGEGPINLRPAQLALAAYVPAGDPRDTREQIADLICDLAHLADALNVYEGFESDPLDAPGVRILAEGGMHYHGEVQGDMGPSVSERGYDLADPVPTVTDAIEDLTKRMQDEVLAELTGEVLSRFPTAAYIEMDVSDQGSDQMFAVNILDIELNPLTNLDWSENDSDPDLIDFLADRVGQLYDDYSAAWKRFQVFPFGDPLRGMTGQPCLDLTAIVAALPVRVVAVGE
jgi:hypothetical protein